MRKLLLGLFILMVGFNVYAKSMAWFCPEGSGDFKEMKLLMTVDGTSLKGNIYSVDILEGFFWESIDGNGMVSIGASWNEKWYTLVEYKFDVSQKTVLVGLVGVPYISGTFANCLITN